MGILIGSDVVSTTAGLLIVPPPAPVPWTPAQLGGALRGWWVPHSLGLSAGDSVASLPSSGGVSNTLSQATAGYRPAYQLFNGKGALSFDGADDCMSMGDLTISNAAPALVMWGLYQYSAIPADAQFKYFMGVSITGGVNRRMGLFLNNTAGPVKNIGVTYRATDAGSTTSRFSATPADTAPHLIVAQIVFNGSGAPKLDIWRDGTNILNETPAFSPANLGAGDSQAAYVGGIPASANTNIQGLVSQMGINRGGIAVSDRQKLEGYLAWYGGIASSLPPDHPCRAAAPVL